MTTKPPPMSQQYPYLRLADCEFAEPLAAQRGAAKWARGDPSVKHIDEGFMAAYRNAGGRPDRLSEYWQLKRHNFIGRHLAQQATQKNKSWYMDDGSPTDRHLALIMWAYAPDRS